MYSVASLVSTGVILPLLGVILVCLRYWVRLRFAPTFIGADDILIVVGALFTCGMGAIQIGSAIQGDTSPETKPTQHKDYLKYKYNYAIIVIEKVAYGAIKLSILYFYRRIFGIMPRFKFFNNVLIVVTALWAIAFLFDNIFICGVHPEIQWNDRLAADDKCADVGKSDLWFAITDVIGDALIISMPFFVIHTLHMNLREKLAISFVFFLAFLSTVAAALRLAFIGYAYHYGQMAWNPSKPPDPEPPILKGVDAAFWTLVEVAVGVIAANLPPLGPLIRCSPTPKKLISSALRKMSLSHTSTRRSSEGKHHAWDRFLHSGRHEKGEVDSQGTLVDRSDAYSNKTGKKSVESNPPALPDESLGVSTMGASGMWRDAHQNHLGSQQYMNSQHLMSSQQPLNSSHLASNQGPLSSPRLTGSQQHMDNAI